MAKMVQKEGEIPLPFRLGARWHWRVNSRGIANRSMRRLVRDLHRARFRASPVCLRLPGSSPAAWLARSCEIPPPIEKPRCKYALGATQADHVSDFDESAGKVEGRLGTEDVATCGRLGVATTEVDEPAKRAAKVRVSTDRRSCGTWKSAGGTFLPPRWLVHPVYLVGRPRGP